MTHDTSLPAPKRALLIVDVQNDFCEGGALGVDGGNAVAAGLAAYLGRHGGDYQMIISSQDWHRAEGSNGGHFALEGVPDFQETWPVHCVEDTPGAELHPALTSAIDGLSPAVRDSWVRVTKGHGEPAYSAFEGKDVAGRPLADLLREAGITQLDVAGIATDYCVLASARDALREGHEVRLLRELCAGIAPETTRAALTELEAAGAVVR